MKDTITAEREALKAVKFNMSLRLLFHQAINPEVLTEPPIDINTEAREVNYHLSGQFSILTLEILLI